MFSKVVALAYIATRVYEGSFPLYPPSSLAFVVGGVLDSHSNNG
jgi:hypothetical protein